MSDPVSTSEDLAVHQRARALVNEVYQLTRLPSFRRIAAMLSNLIAYLRRSPMRGPKFTPPRISKGLQAVLDKYMRHAPTP